MAVYITNLKNIINRPNQDYNYIYNKDILFGSELANNFLIDILTTHDTDTGTVSFRSDEFVSGNLNESKYTLQKDIKVLAGLLNELIDHPEKIRDHSAIHININQEFLKMPAAYPTGADFLIIEDSENDYNKKKISFQDLFYYVKQDCNRTIYYTVTSDSNEGGVITPNRIIPVKCGSDLSFSISPKTGYEIYDVLVDNESLGPLEKYKFEKITKNCSISAVFSRKKILIQSNCSEHGQINPIGDVFVYYSESQNFTVKPFDGYHISKLVIDGIPQPITNALNFEYEFGSVTEKHSIYAQFEINTYNISCVAKGEGTVAPAGLSVCNYNDSIKFSFIPSSGFEVSSVKANGVDIGVCSGYSISPVHENVHLEVTFAPIYHDINVSKDSAGTGNGTITPPGDSLRVTETTTVTLLFIPDANSEVADVKINGTSKGQLDKYIFSDIKADQDVVVTFNKKQFTITASCGPNGTISPSGNILVGYNETQTFSIIPNTGDITYIVRDVIVDGTSKGSSGTYSFTEVKKDHTIFAYFTKSNDGGHLITATASDGGIISPSGAFYAAAGSNIVFTIVPYEGYHIEHVQDGNINVGVKHKYKLLNINSNKAISVNFEPNPENTYCVTADSDENCTVEPQGSNIYIKNDNATFSISPKTGYQIDQVLVDDMNIGTSESITLNNIDKNHTIYAMAKKIQYSVLSKVNEPSGTINPLGYKIFEYGDTITYSVIPAAHYTITSVLLDGTEQLTTPQDTPFNLDLNITHDSTIEASFTRKTWTVTCSAGPNGTCNPAGTITVDEGTNLTVIFTPEPNYIVSNVIVTENNIMTNIGTPQSYTFKSISADCSVTASFIRPQYTISTDSSNNSAGCWSPDSATVDKGNNQTFTYTTASGYYITKINVDDNLTYIPDSIKLTTYSYTFYNVDSNHTLYAIVEEDTP